MATFIAEIWRCTVHPTNLTTFKFVAFVNIAVRPSWMRASGIIMIRAWPRTFTRLILLSDGAGVWTCAVNFVPAVTLPLLQRII